MALFKVCSRVVCSRVCKPASFVLARNFADGPKRYDQFHEKLEDVCRALPGDTQNPGVEELPNMDELAKKIELTKEQKDGYRNQLENLNEEQRDKMRVLLEADPSKIEQTWFDPEKAEREVLAEVEVDLTTGTEEEVQAALEKAKASELVDSPPEAYTDINRSLPYNEKVKAADLGESYGPAKAEMDSWKRIYAEDESLERLGLPPRAHYWRDGEMYSPFGTLSNPVKIYSQFSHRIVGCRGGNGRPHEIVWVNLGNKYKTMCPECGQMFMLVNYKPEEQEQPHENLDAIDQLRNDGKLREPHLC